MPCSAAPRMASAEVPAEFWADWGVGGAHAPAAHPALAPAEAPSQTGDEGLLNAGASLAALTLVAPRAGGADASSSHPTSNTVEQVAACAVSLTFLRDFHTHCVAPLERDGAPLSTKDVVTRIIMPATQAAAG